MTGDQASHKAGSAKLGKYAQKKKVFIGPVLRVFLCGLTEARRVPNAGLIHANKKHLLFHFGQQGICLHFKLGLWPEACHKISRDVMTSYDRFMMFIS